MESLLWNLRTQSDFALAAPVVHSLLLIAILGWDHFVLLPLSFFKRFCLAGLRGSEPARVGLPAALIVIPSLLRKRDELTSMMSTIRSVATNGYPAELFIVVSIDGCADAPALFTELQHWARAQDYPENVHLYVTGTPPRRGKPMAIEHGIAHLRDLVVRGAHDAFPPVYISTDADADLGEHALERLVARLIKPHPITGWPARAVAGSLYIRGNAFWRGWRHACTEEGQLTLQVARHYMVSNVARHNLRMLPMCGVPGVLYCAWSEIFLSAPKFMSFMRTLRLRDWLMWWLGRPLPSFAQSPVSPVPELLAGDTDDTVMAFMSVLATRHAGHFSFEPPRTPLHALAGMLRLMLIDRGIRYEPAARVYTSSPTTVKSLFKQRKRWNAARIEVTGRFWHALWFYWALGLPALAVMVLVVRSWLFGAVLYVQLPFAFLKLNLLTAFFLGLGCHWVVNSVLTLLALALHGELRYWRLLLAVPLSPFYALVFAYIPAVVGGVSDLLLFGNVTGFAPETTLIRGGSARLALLYRLRRAGALMLRSITRGDVPLGLFWLGWHETRWTPNGYEGWTTGKKPPALRVQPARERS